MTVIELGELALDELDKARESDCECCRMHAIDRAVELMHRAMDLIVGGDLDPNRRCKQPSHQESK